MPKGLERSLLKLTLQLFKVWNFLYKTSFWRLQTQLSRDFEKIMKFHHVERFSEEIFSIGLHEWNPYRNSSPLIFCFFVILKFFLMLVLRKKVIFWKIMFFSGFISRKSENKVKSKLHYVILIFHNLRYDVSFRLKKTDRKNLFSPRR